MSSLFRRNKRAETEQSQDDDSQGKKKADWKRPANTAFKQQRLKAWQPILTPKTVLPTLFIIGLLFAPIGGLLIWGSSTISQITLDYTDCINAGANFSSSTASFNDMPSSAYSYELKNPKQSYATPQWSFQSLSTSAESDPTKRNQCRLRFEIPSDLEAPVFLYYKLTNFFQNHRRYVQSLDTDQLKGKAVSASTLNNGNCRPLGRDSQDPSKAIYPCGLIANSLFNDTLNSPILTSSNTTYNFSQTGIAWPGEARKYAATTQYQLSDILPPPNWRDRYPQGYTNSTPPPNLNTNEHFQNWMRTAGLPTFSKLYGRNDGDVMKAGTYELDVYMNFPVSQFGGTKSVVISTVSWIGGKNPFLGYAYVAAAGLFVLLAVIGLVWHCLKPRKLGDMNLLSWNQPEKR